MILKIEKRGHQYVITNNPPFKYKKIEIQVRDEDIIDRTMEIDKQEHVAPVKQEILQLRKKYPELIALDKLTSDWVVNESDDVLLDNYFNQRAKDEGII